jgi:uncharacterized protein YbjT (DUF2867 family)
MILVCGATGLLGGLIARSLLDRNQKVAILTRPGAEARALIELGARPVEGDLKDPASLSRACRGIDAVVTTVNSAHRQGTADTVETVERSGNIALIDAAQAAGVGHFVFTSVLGVSEESPVPFFAAKARAANHLRASGMPWTVLAPDLFMDVWCKAVVGMRVMRGLPVILASGGRRHSFVAARDVAAFAVAALERGADGGEHVDIGGPAAITWSEVVEAFERASGRRAQVETVPPGTEIAHLTPMQWRLMGLMETYDSVVPMSATAARYGVAQTTIDDFARRFVDGWGDE